MSPIDPVDPVPPKKPPMAPPYVDEDPAMAEVEQGMNVAENERRDAVADTYEATARQSEDPEEALDSIDYTKDDGGSRAPEIRAMEEEYPLDPLDET